MKLLTLIIAATVSVSVQAADVEKVRVTGGTVSLRAAPDINGKLIDRASRDEELFLIEKSEGWVRVQAPERIQYWVYAALVKDDIVQAPTLRVRSQPSTDADINCVVNKGDSVSVVEESNGWFNVAQPESCQLWISADYVEEIGSESTSVAIPVPVAAPMAAPVSTPVSVSLPVAEPETEAVVPVAKAKAAVEEAPTTPMKLVLDSAKPQGVDEEVTGTLRRASSPGLYQLVQVVNGEAEVVSLVRGKEDQMELYLNRSMQMKGKKYWVKDMELPLVQPDKIILVP